MKTLAKAAIVVAVFTVPGALLVVAGYQAYKLWRSKNEKNK